MQRRDLFSVSLLTAASQSRALGANDRLHAGLIGCGGRGRYVARLMREAPNTEFGATAGVYLTNAGKEDFIDAPDASKLLRRVPRKPWDLAF